MRAGLLRHRVVVDQTVTAQNETGEEEVSFVPFVTEWASIEPFISSGREQLHANQVLANIDTKIVMRWSPTTGQIKPTWRIRHGSDIYNIIVVSHIKQGLRQIEIMARSGLNNG